DLHQSAENGAVARGLVSGELSKADYTSLVSQMYLFNRRLDDAVKAHRDEQPSLKALIDDEQLQTPYYEADLADLGVDSASLTPTPGTADAIALVERVEAENPADLLALHYVREGANNGNRFVAKKLMQAWEQQDLTGMKHLDPYGKAQRSKWDAFKETLNAQPFSDDEKRSLVATGREMFKAVIAIHSDVEAGAAAG
ncbi:MAG: biliverdin-producing heme oxygenase, partial [Planctomycetota bacterium]